MEKNKYKIVVLSDLKDTIQTTLKSTISLAKIINGEIEVFSVKKPSEIVEKENQLSAMRSINSKHMVVDKKMKAIIAPISKEYGVKIGYSFAFGHVKGEIDKYIKNHRPDIIVLGKRKSKPLNFKIGDSITEFVLNSFGGTILITTDNDILEPNGKISLGVLNGSEPSANLGFVENLMVHVQKPLKSFKFVKSLSSTIEETPTSSDRKTIEYVFEHNDNTANTLSNYLAGNNINLLFVDRVDKGTNKKVNAIPSDIKEVINKLNTNILVAGNIDRLQ